MKAALALLFLQPALRAGDEPFFVTYTHQLEEPGNLELTIKSLAGRPSAEDHRFLGSAFEFEYGVKGWWTTEVYLDGQGTAGDSALFTGYRWENRFRVLQREHWINPVLYVEFENINGADKTLLEVVGTDGKDDLAGPNSEARVEKQREIETKLILGSYYKGWTIAENFIAEKNVAHAPFEFGYAAAVSRPLGLEARPERCNWCAENFQVGLEVYGGLGTHRHFGVADTSHYIAPTGAWTLANGVSISASPTFGLTGSSVPFMMRFGVSYEIDQFRRSAARLLRGTGGRPLKSYCSVCYSLARFSAETVCARMRGLSWHAGRRRVGKGASAATGSGSSGCSGYALLGFTKRVAGTRHAVVRAFARSSAVAGDHLVTTDALNGRAGQFAQAGNMICAV